MSNHSCWEFYRAKTNYDLVYEAQEAGCCKIGNNFSDAAARKIISVGLVKTRIVKMKTNLENTARNFASLEFHDNLYNSFEMRYGCDS
jgi:hypothetical protein